jgi:hypothetical protein
LLPEQPTKIKIRRKKLGFFIAVRLREKMTGIATRRDEIRFAE